MPRPPNGRVGRSVGAAEHRVIEHRMALALSRTTSRTRATALACVVALALAGAPAVAAAQTSSSSVAGIRSSIDTSANQWFAAQRRAADLDRQIQLLDKELASEQQRVAQISKVADARAVQVYEDNAQGLNTMFGNDPLEVGRRAALVGHANAEGQHAIEELRSSVADLSARRDELKSARAELDRTMTDIKTNRSALDAALAALQLKSARAARRAVLATDLAHNSSSRALAEPATLAASTAPTTVAPVASSGPTSVDPPPDSGAVSPHHNDPFLVCTRARESNGDYTAVSSSGYYGAYQFSPTTWNVTASHMGRLDLVGVLPSRASQYDQDEMAWTLYEWQGNAPWGGRC
jgi:hypothetical protein